MVGARAACAVAAALAVVAVGCGGAEHGNAERSAQADTSVTSGTGPAATGGGAAGAGITRFDVPGALGDAGAPETLPLDARTFEPGDCVSYPHDGGGTVRTVPCDQPHDLQMTRDVASPRVVAYPTAAQWAAFVDAACAAPAEVLIGVPVDPYGRFAVTAITPLAGGWDDSPRDVNCAVGARPTALDDVYPQLTEDLRGLRDQSRHYTVGDCVSYHYPDLPIEIPHTVPCDQPHEHEVTGTVAYADGFGAPPAGKPDARCLDAAEAYLGGPVSAPWQFGSTPLRPETWAAGQHYVHCTLGQLDPDTERVIEVSVSARG
jgi:Septum formation